MQSWYPIFPGPRSDIVNDSSQMNITNSLQYLFDPVSDANLASDECLWYKHQKALGNGGSDYL